MNTYYRILNEIASVFDMDQWDEQVNTFTDAIDKQLNTFIHTTNYPYIYILEHSWTVAEHYFPQYNFYKERCYVNGEKVEIDSMYGYVENIWEDQKAVEVIIKDLDQLGDSCNDMFYRCFSLISVPLLDTNNVTDMKDMFRKCQSLESVPLLDTRKADFNYMFTGCYSLSEETKQTWSLVYDFETNKMK